MQYMVTVVLATELQSAQPQQDSKDSMISGFAIVVPSGLNCSYA